MASSQESEEHEGVEALALDLASQRLHFVFP